MATLFIAAGDSPISFNFMPWVTALIVFAIAFTVLKGKVWPRITRGLDERDRKIRDEIKAAEEAREQAKAALTEYKTSLADARREAGDMIAKAKADAQAVGDDLRRRNETELTEMKDRATRDITAAKQAALTEIHGEAAALASTMAGKILKREVSVQDQQRLMEESLQELGQLTAR